MYKIIGADGKEYGPISTEQLRQWLKQGRVNSQTKIKPAGADDWQTLAALPEFATELAILPPMPPSAIPTGDLPVKTSGLAIASLVLGVLGFCGVTAVAGLILGIVALVKINRSQGRLAGNGFAIAGICVSGFMLLLAIPMMAAMLLPALAKAKQRAQSINCVNNVRQLALGVLLYADANGGQCPPAETWGDAIQSTVGSPQVFQCPGGDQNSRCHYAFNAKLAGLDTKKITNPSVTVMFIETDGGWNLSGGPELMPASSRHGRTFVVGFADGHVESASESRLKEFQWDP